MAEALRPGGLYREGDKYVDANGRPAKGPTSKEEAQAEEAREAAAPPVAPDDAAGADAAPDLTDDKPATRKRT